jgi:hypothetical protein
VEGYVLFPSCYSDLILTVVIDMVAAEERKIAARKSAAKEQKSSEKKPSAPAGK